MVFGTTFAEPSVNVTMISAPASPSTEIKPAESVAVVVPIGSETPGVSVIVALLGAVVSIENADSAFAMNRA